MHLNWKFAKPWNLLSKTFSLTTWDYCNLQIFLIEDIETWRFRILSNTSGPKLRYLYAIFSGSYREYRREYRFDRRVVRETDRYARTRRDCERACTNARFNCNGFAFGNRGGLSGSRDQCELVDQDPGWVNVWMHTYIRIYIYSHVE